MGAKKAELIFLSMTFLISNGLFSCSKPIQEIDESVNEIKIVCNESKMKYIGDFIDEFKTQNPQYKLIIDFEPDEKIEYYINHDQIDADIVLANELLTINGTDDKFVDISRNEYTNEFGKNALVHLKTLAGKIYALPSPGILLTYCVNETLFDYYNFTVPTTINELIDFVRYSKQFAIPYVSSFTENDAFLDVLMQATIPSFYSTPIGYKYFNDVYYGEHSVTTLSSLNQFYESLYNFYELFREKYFDPTKISDKGIDDFFSGKAFMTSLASTMEFQNKYKEKKSDFKYRFIPYLGTSADSNWVLTRPNFYIGTLKKNYEKKKEALDAFNAYFSSYKGQKTLVNYSSDSIITPLISYRTDLNKKLSSNFEDVTNAISEGRLYFYDKFYSLASINVEDYKSYAKDLISTNTLIERINKSVDDLIARIDYSYVIPELILPSDESSNERKKNLIKSINGIFIKYLGVNASILPFDFLKYEIFNGTFSKKEMEIIFDKDVTVIVTKLKGDKLKSICETIFFSKDFSYDFSGVSCFNDDNGYKFLFNNKKEIDDDKEYLLLVPDGFLDDDIEVISKSEKFSCYDLLKRILKENFPSKAEEEI